ncbi:hypothetical protein BYT27DRAFT_7107291 [Phlegmacium glaucopus]|nr:hypothetical protein BYT27DRAFT_7107291 [Phlegmacium glaucopus]
MNIEDEKQFRTVTQFLLRWGIETHGIPPEKRIDRRIHQMFFIWFSVNFNILAFGAGSSGPAFFALGIRIAYLRYLLWMSCATCVIPAYFAVFGPKLGMRAMVQCRFSWGYYAAAIPSTLNVFSSQSFLILNCIIGGQTLATVSHKLDDTLGIVIIGLISSVVTLCGYRFIHWFENFVWIPNVIAFPVLLGVAGRHLNPTTFLAVPPPSAAQIISFGSLVASSIISWCAFTPDYGVYHDANASTMKIFIYSYLGFLLPMLAWNMIGAAFAAAAPGIPSWITGFQEGSNVGGLLAPVLAPAGGFGRFLLVLIALSTLSACAPTIYTFGNSFMAITPLFARVPRYVFTVVSTAILIPLAIIGAKHFYTVLVNILSVIGYWSTIFAAIILTEHFLFRKNNFNSYQIQDWDKPSKLPIGIAALLSFLGGFGIVIPSMSQVWYIGPIAKAGTGDIGVLTGAVVGAALYVILRALEKRIFLGC